MNKIVKKVAIIGSGQSGLTSAKYALENGLQPVVFDKAKIPGGLWASGDNHETNIWENLYSNISTQSMSYSDHFFPRNSSIFGSKKDIHRYLLSYIKRFQLDKHFRMQTKVEKASQLENKKWQLESINTETNTKMTEVFDFLIVASGML